MDYIHQPINFIRAFFLESLNNQVQNIRERIFPNVLKFISISVIVIPIILLITGINNYFSFLLQSLATCLISVTIILVIIFKDDLLQYFNDDDFIVVEAPKIEEPVLVKAPKMEEPVLVEAPKMENEGFVVIDKS